MSLREYQVNTVREVRASIATGAKSVIAVLATGGGKSRIMAEIVRLAVEKGNRCLFLVHRRGLVNQFYETCTEHGAEAGKIMAGEETKLDAPVQVATIQTFARRAKLVNSFGCQPFLVESQVVLIDECLSPDTEILTAAGWKFLPDVNAEMEVAQYNQSTKEISFCCPEKIIRKPFLGDLVHITGKQTDILCTPEHEQPFFINKTMAPMKKAAGDWKVSGSHCFPVAGFSGNSAGITPFQRFLIMAAADGCFINTNYGADQKIQFQFSKERKIERFRKIVEDAALRYTQTKDVARKGEAKAKTRFTVFAPMGTQKGLKHIENISEIGASWGLSFISELLEWDGSKKKGVLYWSGTNQEDADFIQSVCAVSGITCNRNIQKDNRKETYKDVHRMVFVFSDVRGCQAIKKEMVTYVGDVHCVRVPDANIIIRRNNKVSITGNCHRSCSKQYQDAIDYYRGEGAIIIGFTATPARGDGRPLGEIFEKLVQVIDVQELTDLGYLSPCRYFAPSAPALEDVKIVRGDYDVKELDKRMNQVKLVGDVVENWLRLASGRKTIVFAVSVAHSKALAAEFNRNGISTYHLQASSTDEQREYAFQEMERGNIQVICNVALYQEGVDVPDISCVVLARPTKNLGLYRQMAGRGLRPSPGKGELYLLDHGGCIEENGLLTDPIEWTLEGKKKAWRKAKGKKPKEKKDSICSSCALIFSGSTKCPDCGSEAKSFGQKVETVDGDLEEIGGKRKATMEEKTKFQGMLRYYARAKGFKDGWVYWKYKERFGVAPKNGLNSPPIQPDDAFYSWMKHLAIKYHKGKERGENGRENRL
jgi:superfamily II DNA or RNA helicase